jgi:DNA-binding XRE family transcriptional regulator
MAIFRAALQHSLSLCSAIAFNAGNSNGLRVYSMSIPREILMTISVTHLYSSDQTDTPFAEKIAAARHTAGYTIEQLAITCGLTVEEIVALEDGSDSNPSHIQRVAAALQIPLSSIV